MQNEPAREIMVLITQVTSEGSGKPAQMVSLRIRNGSDQKSDN